MRDGRKLIAILSIILVACLAGLFIVFNALIGRYQSNIAYDSADHLIELNHQVKASVDTVLTDDQSFLDSVSTSLAASDITDKDELLVYLRKQQQIWGIESIRVYTADGACYDQDGIALNRDAASRFAYKTIENGSSVEVTDSMMEIGTPIDTTISIDGSPIVVVSSVRNLDSLIDDKCFQSFQGQGYIYLTQNNGVKVSQSTTNDAPIVFNVSSLFEGGTLTCLSQSGLTMEEAMDEGTESVFLIDRQDDEARYVVMTPVDVLDQTWYLFYLAPEAMVNQTMTDFTRYITMLSFVVILIFIALLLIFVFVYRARAKRYAQDIREREHLFDLLVSDTDNVFFLLSEEQDHPRYISSNAMRMFGTTDIHVDHDAGGMRLSHPDGSVDQTLEGMNETLASWDGINDLTSDYIPYGDAEHPCYLVLRLYPAKDEVGECVGIAQDVTQERERETALRSALTLADSANKAKTQFLSSMSHDIRTPMNAIVNMARFAMEDADDPDRTREELGVIQASSEHLLRLINDVLDMSRIESGKLTFSSEPFDLIDILDGAEEIIRPLCGTKGQTFTGNRIDIVHEHLIGDPLRLNQILINLLNNASKFTPEGGSVRFDTAELHTLKTDTACFRFTVTDNGIGMSEQTLGGIFEPFSRGNEQSVSSIEGSGLGLSISKSFIDALGGSIDVVSALGDGSTFTVELFFRIDVGLDKSQKASGAGDETARFDGRRALVVEDNPINQIIACKLIESAGFSVDIADDGTAAVEKIGNADTIPYDIIYMDIQMPGMDGYAATRAIRALHIAAAKTIPIVAMTANVFAEDVERARQADMDAHIGKPIDPRELNEVTRMLLADDETRTT